MYFGDNIGEGAFCLRWYCRSDLEGVAAAARHQEMRRRLVHTRVGKNATSRRIADMTHIV